MARHQFDITQLYQSKNTIFNTKEIALIWGETDLNLLKSALHYYVKVKKLYAIRRGIYAKNLDYNRFELATKIYTPAYISLETVLQKEGIIFQNYQDIFIISYLSREFCCDGQNYIFHKIKNDILTDQTGIQNKEDYFIASKERAFLDSLYLYKNYYYDNLSLINFDICFNMVKIYHQKSLEKRLDSYYKNFKNA